MMQVLNNTKKIKFNDVNELLNKNKIKELLELKKIPNKALLTYKSFLINNNNFIKIMLIKYDVPVNYRYQKSNTLLHLFCIIGNLEMVKFLSNFKELKYNLRNNNKNTPLMEAVINKHYKIVEFLCSNKKVDPNVKNDKKLNAYDLCDDLKMKLIILSSSRFTLVNNNPNKKLRYFEINI